MSFAITATGTPPLNYQWQFNGTNIASATNSLITINNAQPTNGGGYRVIVSNPGGAVTSAVASLTVGLPPSITAEPEGQIVAVGTSASFTVGAIGTPNLNYQWRFNGTNIAGATNTSFTISNAQPANGGNYVVVVTNAYGAATSSVATLTVHYSIVLNIQGQGSVSKTPNQPFYDVGEQVTLSAAPGRWFRFAVWGDGPAANPRLITIGLSNTYTAIFSPTTAVETLTFSNVSRVAPVGMPALFVDGEFIPAGTVARTDSAEISMLTTFPNGSIFFTLDGSDPSFVTSLYDGPFAVNRPVTVRALAYDASFGNSWEADPVSVSIEPTYAVSATTPGGGSIALSPSSGAYSNNALVTLSATPLPGWTFLQWLGDASGPNSTNTVRVTRDLCGQALFGTSLGTTVAGNGSVIIDPVAPLYPFGTVVRLTGLPQAGNFFAAWGNAASSTNNPLLFAVTNANPTVSCAFGSLGAGEVALTVVVNGQGRVTANPRGSRFNTNQNVTLTAVPGADQSFAGWSGDASGVATNLVVTMNQSRVINANFTANPRLSIGPCRGGLREDGFQFTLTGSIGARYQIDRAMSLANWAPLAIVTNSFGTAQFTDTSATNGMQRFYRLRLTQ